MGEKVACMILEKSLGERQGVPQPLHHSAVVLPCQRRDLNPAACLHKPDVSPPPPT